jgi:outer membrane protein TolC
MWLSPAHGPRAILRKKWPPYFVGQTRWESPQECERETCVKQALESHPEVIKARDEVEKATAAVRQANLDIKVPDVEAFARYSYQNNVPFLARNFGTFGVHFGYDLFDSGRKQKKIFHESATRLSSQCRQRTTNWNGPSK